MYAKSDSIEILPTFSGPCNVIIIEIPIFGSNYVGNIKNVELFNSLNDSRSDSVAIYKVACLMCDCKYYVK